jgi:hypothetical protein
MAEVQLRTLAADHKSEIHRFIAPFVASRAAVESSFGRLDRARPLVCPPAMAGNLFGGLNVWHFPASRDFKPTIT